MSNVHTRAINKALSMLDALGAKYHIQYEGSEYGEPIGKVKKTKKSVLYPGLTDYVRSHVDGISKGETRYVPASAQYPIHAIQSCTTTVMSHRYGNGTYMTSRSSDKTKVEVLRLI